MLGVTNKFQNNKEGLTRDTAWHWDDDGRKHDVVVLKLWQLHFNDADLILHEDQMIAKVPGK